MKSVPLGDIATLVRGVSFSKEEGSLLPLDGHLPVIRAGSIQESLLLSEGRIWVPANKIKNIQRIRIDDIVMCTSSGSSNLVGKCARSTENFDGSFGAFCAGIRADQEKASPSYLYHFLCSPVFKSWTSISSGANIKNIRVSELAEFKVPLPPLPEQKRIAAILDKADAIRRKRQQAIQLADDFLRAMFLDMFGDPVTNPKGWEVKPLGQISTFENGDRSSAYPSGDDLVSEGVLFLSTKNIVSDTLRLESCQYITEDKYTALSRGKARKGDLIITLRGTLGSCCVFDCEHEKAFINAQMMIIRPGAGIGNIFLHDLLVSKVIKNHLQGIGQGAAVPQLTAKQLKELMLPIPPIQEQKRYENIRGSVLASIKKMQSESEESLFNAITQKAFTGQL